MNSQDCEVTVKFEGGQKVVVEFLAFNVESDRNCSNDWLEIYGGKNWHARKSATLLAPRMCGNQLFEPIISPGNYLKIHFHTDSSGTDSGFQLRVHYLGMNKLFLGMNEKIKNIKNKVKYQIIYISHRHK